MPVVTITFDLPEEEEEYSICANAGKFHAITSEVLGLLRHRRKYQDKETVNIVELEEFIYGKIQEADVTEHF